MSSVLDKLLDLEKKELVILLMMSFLSLVVVTWLYLDLVYQYNSVVELYKACAASIKTSFVMGIK